MYLTLAIKHGATPTWIFNDKIENSAWKFIPWKLLHPREVPFKLQRHTVVIVQSGESMDLIQAGVYNAIPLTVDHLKQLQGHFKFPVASKPHGHGKDGNRNKTDWVLGLINHFFAEVPQAEKNRMLKGIRGQTQRHLDSSKSTKHNKDILKAFNGLDPADQKYFAELVADEKRLFKERQKGEARKPREIKETYSGKQHVTPGVLAGLVPEGGRLSRHPALKRYQAFFWGSQKGSSARVSVIHPDFSFGYLLAGVLEGQ